MTSRQANVVLAAAFAAGGAAGILGALGVALVSGSPTAASARSRHPPAVAAAVAAGNPDADVDAALFHVRLEEHGREAIDPSWAREAQRAYERDLRGIAANAGFSLRSVDCRTTSCVADLTFGSYAAAKASMKNIVLSRWTVNCVKEMNLDRAADESAAYTTSIYFDCASARTSNSVARK